jgi:hypothetical protein
VRRLDRSRPYGYLTPVYERRAFVQDNIVYDRDGFQLDPPPDDAAPLQDKQSALPLEGVSVSRPTLTLKPVTVEKKPAGTLSPRTEREWQTVDFKRLRRDLKKDFGVEVSNQKSALKVLRERNLIKGA